MAIWKGSVLTKVSEVSPFSGTSGFTTKVVWQGREAEIIAKADELIALGYDTDIDPNGALHTLTGTKTNTTAGGSGSAAEGLESATQTWAWSTEQITKDIFAHPQVAAEAVTYGAAAYRKAIEDAISQGIALQAPYSGYTVAPSVYALLSRGETGFEIEYIVLTRRLTFSDRYPTRLQMDAVSKLYTTAQLIATFNEPSLELAASGLQWRIHRRKPVPGSDPVVFRRVVN